MVAIRLAAVDDAPVLAQLMNELDLFYGGIKTEPSERRTACIERELFGDRPAGYVALAFEKETLLGMIAYSFVWPARGVSSMIFVKELFVTHTFRRRGVGKMLFRFVCQVAIDRQCTRVAWQTDLNNARANDFYDSIACSAQAASIVLSEKVSYCLDADQLTKLSD